MQNKFVIIILIFVWLSGCKKDDNSNDNTVINTSISNGFPPGGPDYLNGFFYAQKQILTPDGIVSYFSEAGLSSSTEPLLQFYYLSSIIMGMESAGIVKINSTTLKLDKNSANRLTYMDTTINPDYNNGVTWTVAGNTNFSAFTTTVTRGFPKVNNPDYLPLTVSKSQPLIIHTGGNNYTNTDSIMVSISDGNTFVYQYLSGKDSIFTFTQSDLSNLNTGTINNQLVVYAKNFSNMVVNNKRYVFAMHTDVIQFVSIVP